MSCKKNKIIENAPPGYYVCDYTLETGFWKTPIIAFVYYFNNSQEEQELITTNYLTIYSSNYCYRSKSNYNYLIQPDGLVYPINIYESIGLTEEEFIEKRKADYNLNSMSNVQNQEPVSEPVNNFTYFNNTTYDTDDVLNQKYSTTSNTTNDVLNQKYKNTTTDYYDFNENYTYEWNSNYNLDWNINNSKKNTSAYSHLKFDENKEILYFDSMEKAGEYCFKNKYSSLNNNICFNNKFYNASTYLDYVLFFGNSYDNNESVFTYYPTVN